MKNSEGVTPVELGRVGDRPMWILSLSIVIRAIHQVGAAVFLASFLLDDGLAAPPVYLLVTVVSGCLLFATEGMRHRQIYREVAGMSTFIKVILLGGAFHGFLPETITVLSAFIIASLGAHAPKIIRHRLLF
ncbi:MAG: hypothetical protein V2I35_13595 [Desulfocapsaceae bacterium]|jgi:hypothetical protein|nr:hypothetical protein [Desulfocapsaceae bacterium]